VPVGIDAERLDVDPLLVHRLEPVRGPRHQERLRLDLASHQRHRLGHGAVRVDVDRLDASAVHDDLAPPRLSLGRRGGGQTAPDEGATGHCAGGSLDELTASAHRVLLQMTRACRATAPSNPREGYHTARVERLRRPSGPVQGLCAEGPMAATFRWLYR